MLKSMKNSNMGHFSNLLKLKPFFDDIGIK